MSRVQISRDNRRRHILWLVTAHVLLGLIAMGALHVSERPLVAISAVGLWVAQGSLLGIWVVFGGTPRAWRLIAAGSVAIALGWLLEAWFHVVWASYAFFFLVCTGVPLLAVRFLGLRLDRFGDEARAIAPWRGQYSVRLLLEWTLGFAVLLSLFQLMPRESASHVTSSSVTYEFFAVMVFDVPVVVASCLLGLGWPVVAKRAAVTLGLFAASGLVMVIVNPFGDTPGVGLALGIQTAIVLSSLFVFRSLGYRLVWRNREIA